jgi:hypothetical protein
MDTFSALEKLSAAITAEDHRNVEQWRTFSLIHPFNISQYTMAQLNTSTL